MQHNVNNNIEINIKLSRIRKKETNYIKVEFKDNGIGITDDMKIKIFDRGIGEARSVRGMGIGLSLLKIIMDEYDGKIYVEDKVSGDYNQGSNFIILLKESKK